MENDENKLSIKKFISSFFSLLPWIKTSRFIIGAIIIFFIGVTIWRAYFRKDIQQTQTQKQETTITQAPGSTVNLGGPAQTQTTPKSRIEPFAIVIGGITGEKKKNSGWFLGTGVGFKF